MIGIVIRKLVWAVVLVIYTLLAAEAFLRAFFPIPLVPRYVCPTPWGIRGNEPNRVYRHVSPFYNIEMRTNSKGIRADREIPYEKPAGVKRIVLLGDSFGMGYEVSLEDSFLSQMERSLQQAGVACEAVNLSVSGFGNAEQLIFLQEEGFKYQPDLVVLAWHVTDYDDNVRCGLYTLTDSKLQRNNASYLPGTRAQQVLYSIPGYQWVADNSQLYNFVRERVAIRIKKLLAWVRKVKSPAAAGAAGPSEDAKRKYAHDLTVALLREIEARVTAAGAKFLVLDIPERLSEDSFKSHFPVDDALRSMTVYSPIGSFLQNRRERLYWTEHSHRHFTPVATRLVGEGLGAEAMKLWSNDAATAESK